VLEGFKPWVSQDDLGSGDFADMKPNLIICKYKIKFPGDLPVADPLYATQLEQQSAATLAFDVEPPGWLQLSLLSAAQLPTSAATVQPARQDFHIDSIV